MGGGASVVGDRGMAGPASGSPVDAVGVGCGWVGLAELLDELDGVAGVVWVGWGAVWGVRPLGAAGSGLVSFPVVDGDAPGVGDAGKG